MKFLKVVIFTLFLATSVSYAKDSQKNIVEVMMKMEKGLNDMQKGFLYNNIALIKSGIDVVQKENHIYQEQKNVVAMLPKNKKLMKNAAMLTSFRIENSSRELKEYIKLKQMRNAYNAYSNILNACTDCHVLVRGW